MPCSVLMAPTVPKTVDVVNDLSSKYHAARRPLEHRALQSEAWRLMAQLFGANKRSFFAIADASSSCRRPQVMALRHLEPRRADAR